MHLGGARVGWFRGPSCRHTGEVRTALVVDRSLILKDQLDDLYGLRNQVASEVARQLGHELATVIAYAEIARSASIEEATEPGVDFVYGSNLQHALLMGRVANRTMRSSRIVLVTYNMPSAHHTAEGDVYFDYPPIPQTLEAVRVEGRACTSDGIRIDTLLVARDVANDDNPALEDFFRPIAVGTGGKLVLVTASDQIDISVDRLLNDR